MNILDSYLTYLTEQKSAWKRRVALGKISPADIKRLKSSGLVKSRDEYIRGLEKGSQNIADKYGTKIQRGRTASKLGPGYDETKNIIRLPHIKKKVSPLNPMIKKYLDAAKQNGINSPEANEVIKHLSKEEQAEFLKNVSRNIKVYEKQYGPFYKLVSTKKGYEEFEPYAKRHEADEARGFKKMTSRAKSRSLPGEVALSGRYSRSRISSHISPEVLEKERKYLTTAKTLYGDKAASSLIKSRGGEYKALDKLGKNQYRRFLRNIPNLAISTIKDEISLNKQFPGHITAWKKRIFRQRLLQIIKSKPQGSKIAARAMKVLKML